MFSVSLYENYQIKFSQREKLFVLAHRARTDEEKQDVASLACFFLTENSNEVNYNAIFHAMKQQLLQTKIVWLRWTFKIFLYKYSYWCNFWCIFKRWFLKGSRTRSSYCVEFFKTILQLEKELYIYKFETQNWIRLICLFYIIV